MSEQISILRVLVILCVFYVYNSAWRFLPTLCDPEVIMEGHFMIIGYQDYKFKLITAG